ncbi:MAG: hypothetical protein GX236_06255 [Clostridiaceae bacterium]|jgi:hypothetical protein|nr:hypothetical protein [Clostridiaceae bacterium]
MNKNVKNITVIICFISIIFGFMVSNIIKTDRASSYSERRKLAEFPQISFEKLFSGDWFEEFEKYSLDQFVFRDGFRTIKAIGMFYLFYQNDNNGIYIVDGNISKIDYPLNEKSVINAAEKLNEVYEKYLQGLKVYYSIIPDKNYFLAAENGYLGIDYDIMQKIMDQNIENMKYINLFDSLAIEDYYKTDIHWSQEKILKATNKLLNELGSDIQIDESQYSRKELYPFYGSYYRQLALSITPDKLIYMTNDLLEKAEVYDYESKTYSNVYMPDRFNGMDAYDVFLSGAKALITIENPESTADRELILFRDSFGSSIAPLLLSSYSKITLVDLRYISTDLLGEFVEFSEKQDVLFLYNTQIINNSYMLK